MVLLIMSLRRCKMKNAECTTSDLFGKLPQLSRALHPNRIPEPSPNYCLNGLQQCTSRLWEAGPHSLDSLADTATRL